MTCSLSLWFITAQTDVNSSRSTGSTDGMRELWQWLLAGLMVLLASIATLGVIWLEVLVLAWLLNV